MQVNNFSTVVFYPSIFRQGLRLGWDRLRPGLLRCAFLVPRLEEHDTCVVNLRRWVPGRMLEKTDDQRSFAACLMNEGALRLLGCLPVFATNRLP